MSSEVFRVNPRFSKAGERVTGELSGMVEMQIS